MHIQLLVVGKTDSSEMLRLLNKYTEKIKHYIDFSVVEIPKDRHIKRLSRKELRQREGEKILDRMKSGSRLILLDERGKEFSSIAYSRYLQQWMNTGVKQLTFVIGGAFGFSDEVYSVSHAKISLSKMTFPHQLVRVFFLEQTYRAFSILRNEPYHHGCKWSCFINLLIKKRHFGVEPAPGEKISDSLFFNFGSVILQKI